MDINLIHIARAATEAAAQEASSGGVIGTLGLNLKLFIAQLINFGIIVLILWKWVFNPVARKLTERTEKIEKSLNDADRINKEKQEFEAWREQEMSKARKQANEIITASQTESIKVKDQILQETKMQQEQLAKQAKQQIQMEKEKSLQSIKNDVADMVTQAAEKILRGKLDDKKDKELIKNSLDNIKL